MSFAVEATYVLRLDVHSFPILHFNTLMVTGKEVDCCSRAATSYCQQLHTVSSSRGWQYQVLVRDDVAKATRNVRAKRARVFGFGSSMRAMVCVDTIMKLKAKRCPLLSRDNERDHHHKRNRQSTPDLYQSDSLSRESIDCWGDQTPGSKSIFARTFVGNAESNHHQPSCQRALEESTPRSW